MWHVTCDLPHVTPDMWHVTRDMWHMTHDRWVEVNLISQFQLPNSYSLWIIMCWRFGGKEWLTTKLINGKAVCRTAPATPGLLNICILDFLQVKHVLKNIVHVKFVASGGKCADVQATVWVAL